RSAHFVLFGKSTGVFLYLLFFFQAEDGIRDFHVTGVQTCALPIYFPCPERVTNSREREMRLIAAAVRIKADSKAVEKMISIKERSEERRVGKECRWR